ncbi:MAG TPA: hypothetical protein VJT50_04895 [Pyrinomonadaceae bacterium]|nr:hypothetical protein [Pyrinomonadaceae bacterium]
MFNRLSLAILITGMLALTSSCAGSLFKVQPVVGLPELPETAQTASAGGVTIKVAPLMTDEQSQDLFEANLPLGGVLPVRLRMDFESGVPVELKRARFKMIDEGGREWKIVSAKSAVSRILKANEVYAYNPNSRKQFEKEFGAYAIDLSHPLSNDNRRAEGFLFFEAPKNEPVSTAAGLTLRIERLAQPIEIKLN